LCDRARQAVRALRARAAGRNCQGRIPRHPRRHAKGLPAARASAVWSASVSEHVAVVGAGVFGAWTATHLQRAGHRVTLVDAHGPAHSRASSGGESRLIRAAYGKDAIYTRMALDSLPQWKALSDAAGLPIFI